MATPRASASRSSAGLLLTVAHQRTSRFAWLRGGLAKSFECLENGSVVELPDGGWRHLPLQPVVILWKVPDDLRPLLRDLVVPLLRMGEGLPVEPGQVELGGPVVSLGLVLDFFRLAVPSKHLFS